VFMNCIIWELIIFYVRIPLRILRWILLPCLATQVSEDSNKSILNKNLLHQPPLRNYSLSNLCATFPNTKSILLQFVFMPSFHILLTRNSIIITRLLPFEIKRISGLRVEISTRVKRQLPAVSLVQNTSKIVWPSGTFPTSLHKFNGCFLRDKRAVGG